MISDQSSNTFLSEENETYKIEGTKFVKLTQEKTTQDYHKLATVTPSANRHRSTTGKRRLSSQNNRSHKNIYRTSFINHHHECEEQQHSITTTAEHQSKERIDLQLREEYISYVNFRFQHIETTTVSDELDTSKKLILVF